MSWVRRYDPLGPEATMRYDRNDLAAREREFLGTRVYMGHHPVIRGLFRGDGRPTEFGDKVWATTLTVMRHLDGRRLGRVLEIGCGWGLLGVHLARRGARVTCSDVDPHLAPVVAAVAALNGVSIRFLRAGFAELPESELRCDLVVGVEVCYSDAAAADLLGLLARAPAGTEVTIADPGRPDFVELSRLAGERLGATVTRIGGPEDAPCSLLTLLRPLRVLS